MTEKPEKKPRRKLTLADHTKKIDGQIAATEAKLEKLRAKRRALLADAKAKAEAALREAKAAAEAPGAAGE